jgi:hypothetical protein
MLQNQLSAGEFFGTLAKQNGVRVARVKASTVTKVVEEFAGFIARQPSES